MSWTYDALEAAVYKGDEWKATVLAWYVSGQMVTE